MREQTSSGRLALSNCRHCAVNAVLDCVYLSQPLEGLSIVCLWSFAEHRLLGTSVVRGLLKNVLCLEILERPGVWKTKDNATMCGKPRTIQPCSGDTPKGPFRTKNTTALDSVVFYYCRSVLLSVAICCLISL